MITAAAPGREDDFHEWYDAQHLPDCVKVPGVTGAKRYKIIGAVGPGNVEQASPFQSLALYELETDDPMAVARELSARAGTPDMKMTDAVDRAGAVKYIAVEAGEA